MTLVEEFSLDPVQARAALGAFTAVVEADGAAGANGKRLLEVVAQALGLEDAPGGLPPMTSAQLGNAFPSPTTRRTLCDLLLVAACIEGEVTARGESVVREFAASLGVRSHWVDLLPALRLRRDFSVKRQLVRRSPDARRLFQRTWAEEGLVGVARAISFVLGWHVNPKLAERFRSLATLSEGSFGRTFFDHIASRGLAFPGEPGGIPERMVHHDLMHVVNGYGTDAAGECELAGFYAGFCPGDSMTFVVIVLATFQLGMGVSPAAVTPTRGAFDPARVLAAFLRGRRLAVDVMGPWDYWALMPLPLDAVRERLGIGDGAECRSPARESDSVSDRLDRDVPEPS